MSTKIQRPYVSNPPQGSLQTPMGGRSNYIYNTAFSKESYLVLPSKPFLFVLWALVLSETLHHEPLEIHMILWPPHCTPEVYQITILRSNTHLNSSFHTPVCQVEGVQEREASLLN